MSEMQKRKFSKEEKLKILSESKIKGVEVTLAKYSIYPLLQLA